MKAISGVVGVLAGLIVLAAIAVGGWQLGWWLKGSAVNHTNHIVRSSYEFQQAQITDMDQLLTQIGGIDVQITQQPQNAGPLKSQRAALESQFCNDYQSVTAIQIPSNLHAFAVEACSTPQP